MRSTTEERLSLACALRITSDHERQGGPECDRLTRKGEEEARVAPAKRRTRAAQAEAKEPEISSAPGRSHHDRELPRRRVSVAQRESEDSATVVATASPVPPLPELLTRPARAGRSLTPRRAGGPLRVCL